MAKHIVVICGYRTILDKPFILRYLDRVILFCNNHQPDIIIFSGGYTNGTTNPKQSEASVMQAFVIDSLLFNKFQSFIEENSYTSFDNIRLVTAKIRREELLDRETKITIFCESGSANAIDMLALHFLRRNVDIQTGHWRRESPAILLLAENITWLCIHIPLLAQFWSWYRKRRYKKL